jgi:hypothetical protein
MGLKVDFQLKTGIPLHRLWSKHGNMYAPDVQTTSPEVLIYDIRIYDALNSEFTISSALIGFQWAIDCQIENRTLHNK